VLDFEGREVALGPLAIGVKSRASSGQAWRSGNGSRGEMSIGADI